MFTPIDMGTKDKGRNAKGAQARLLEIIKNRLKPEGPNKVVVASHRGKAAVKLAEILGKQAQITSITEFVYDDETKKEMKKLNITVVEKANLPIQDNREMRETLLMFGSEIKAALEVAVIAKNMKIVQGEFITVAGGEEGLNTALLVNTEYPEKEAVSDPTKQLRVEEFLLLPR